MGGPGYLSAGGELTKHGLTRPRSREISTWDAPTESRFLVAAAESPFRDFYHLAVLTGMRRSELAGLKWESVDLSVGKLSVVRTLQRIRRMGLVEGQPKTAKSRRLITLSPDTVQLLHGIRGRQIEERLALGATWQDTGFAFTRPDGGPIDPDGATQEFTELVRAAGLPHLTLHGLRHVHATLMLGAGIHPKVVSERLGHSTVGITLDTYSHVLRSRPSTWWFRTTASSGLIPTRPPRASSCRRRARRSECSLR